jgi:hypothetical protein
MRPALPRAIARWMSVPFVFLALLAFEGFSSAQVRLVSSRDHVRRGTLLSERKVNLVPVRAGISSVRPPNTSDSWTGSGDGTSWNNAANWNSGVPNSSTVDVTIGTTTASVNDNLTASVGNLTLSHAGDGLTISNGIILSVFGSAINNAGTITLGSVGSFTELALQGNVTLSGGGTVTLSNNIQNYILGAASTDTLTNQETIQGAGHIGNGSMALVNSGTINANQAQGMIIQANGNGTTVTSSNTGIIEATAGPLELLSMTLANTGGTISANGSTLQVTSTTINGGNVTLTGASTLQLNNGTIHGGSTLTNSATGTIEVLAGNNTLGGTINNSAGGTFKIDNGAVLNLETGTYSQLGAVQLNSIGSFTELVLQGNTTLSGGTVTLSNNFQNYIFGAVGTDVLTNQETIQGAGQIGHGQMGLINSGSILANQSAGMLIQTSSAGFTNTGTLGVSSGDLMHVSGGPFTNFSGSTLTGGTYNVSGTLQIDELGNTGGEIVTNAANIILNGAGSSFVDSASKDALANLNTNSAKGAFTVSGGRNFTTAGNFNNLGTLTVGSGSAFTVTGTLAQISGSTLSGGTFVLGGNLNVGSGINITTNSSTLTLEGGTIMSGGTNALLGLASNTKSLTIAGAATSVITTAASFSNTGTLTINSGDSFQAATLTQLTGTNNNKTLSAGTYVLAGNLNLTTSGLSITKNSATLTLEGGTINSNGVNALSALASNTKSLTIAGTGTNVSTTAASFSNTGTLTINSGDSFTAPALTQISGSTLTAGTYVLAGNLDLTAAANITTNSAKLTLEGGTIQTGATNDLANLSSNTGSFTLANNASFTAVGNFSNSGALTVNKGSTFGVTGTLTNLSAGTLTGGTYTVGGTMQLASANGGITTNAANLTLTGASAKILDGTSNALAGFNNNTGTFTLSGSAALTTAASSNFTNSGTVVVSKGSTLTVGGTNNSYNQSGGQTTVDGTLVGKGTTGISVTGGTILGSGTLKTNLSIGGGGTSPTINVGDSGKAGLLKITGTYAQLSTGAMNVSIGGTTVGTQYSQLQVSGTASLGGALTAALVNAFTPTVGQTFTVMTAGSITGAFANSTIAINGSEHFVVSYTSTSVVLTVVSGPSRNSSNSTAPLSRMAIARTKQTRGIIRHPVPGDGLRHGIGGRGKLSTVAGRQRPGEHSNPSLAHLGIGSSPRNSLARPILSAWNRIPMKTEQPSRLSGMSFIRQSLPASNNWSGLKQSANLRPALPSLLDPATTRYVMPVRTLPRQMLRLLMRLGR